MTSNHRVLEKPFWSDEERELAMRPLSATDLSLFHADFLSQVCIGVCRCMKVYAGVYRCMYKLIAIALF